MTWGSLAGERTRRSAEGGSSPPASECLAAAGELLWAVLRPTSIGAAVVLTVMRTLAEGAGGAVAGAMQSGAEAASA